MIWLWIWCKGFNWKYGCEFNQKYTVWHVSEKTSPISPPSLVADFHLLLWPSSHHSCLYQQLLTNLLQFTSQFHIPSSSLPPMNILFPLLREIQAFFLGASVLLSFYRSLECSLGILYFRLISTYKWKHTMHVLSGLDYLAQDDIRKFYKSTCKNPWCLCFKQMNGVPLYRCTTFSLSIIQLSDI